LKRSRLQGVINGLSIHVDIFINSDLL